MFEPVRTQMAGIQACHRTCIWCSGGAVDAHNTGLLCARYGPDFPCAVIDIERAIHADNRQDVRDVVSEAILRKWAGVRGIPEHDAIATLLPGPVGDAATEQEATEQAEAQEEAAAESGSDSGSDSGSKASTSTRRRSKEH